MAAVSNRDVMDKVQEMAKNMATKEDIEELKQLLQQNGGISQGDDWMIFCIQHIWSYTLSERGAVEQ